MSPTLRRHRALEVALIGLLLLGIAANLWAMRVAKGRVYTTPPPLSLPLDFQGWKGTALPDDPGTQAILPHARINSVRYDKSDQPPVEFIVIASRDPNDMHTPERCILGSGFQIVRDEGRTLTVPGTEGGTWPLHRLLLRHDKDEALMLYTYDGLGTVNSSTLMARVAMKLGGARKDPAYFVRLSTPTAGDPAAAEARLMAFAADMMRVRRSWELPPTTETP
jgi:EpsI family protein